MKPAGLDSKLISRFDVLGPRYTSYPTAMQFAENFDQRNYVEQTELSNSGGKPLSLYIHIPFCESLCYYCACTKIISQNTDRAASYLDNLFREAEIVSRLFDQNRNIEQLHLGGGTPTYFSDDQLWRLMGGLTRLFNFSSDCECSIEVDPRTVSTQRLTTLAEMGFNRLSLGVQDFDKKVQQAINRIQPRTQTIRLIDAARTLGFKSVSVDLIYGLPHQTLQRFDRTLDLIIDASPDRISLYSYAHLPDHFKAQRLINARDLPSGSDKINILVHSIEKLTQAGYVYIGMDHFARADDELAIARASGGLHRNFQGYSTHSECDLIGLGISSISRFGNCFSQNVKKTKAYSTILETEQLPIERGIVLNDDDKLRGAVIQNIMCDGEIDFVDIGRKFEVEFTRYFSDELNELRSLQDDGLVSISNTGVTVTDTGRLLQRVIAMVFDNYHQRSVSNQRFSKVI